MAAYFAHFEHIPFIFTPHGIYPPRSFANALLKSTFDHTFGQSIFNFSERIIALSEHNIRLLLQMGAPLDKIAIVPNGIDVDEFKNLRNEKTPDELGSKAPILLYVGRIDWNKQIEKVIKSMPLILKEFPSAKFFIVGPDYANHTVELLDLAKELKVEHSLIITGKVSREKLGEFYSIADIFILPSTYEGFGLSMLEAMISRIPVVVSPSGGPGDILDHGVHAWLLKSVTPAEIFKSVHAVLTDWQLREFLINNAFELVKERYTWKGVVNKLEQIYNEAILKENAKP
jgi:glycosyltransferase involved in cell wall biosynthesis